MPRTGAKQWKLCIAAESVKYYTLGRQTQLLGGKKIILLLRKGGFEKILNPAASLLSLLVVFWTPDPFSKDAGHPHDHFHGSVVPRSLLLRVSCRKGSTHPADPKSIHKIMPVCVFFKSCRAH